MPTERPLPEVTGSRFRRWTSARTQRPSGSPLPGDHGARHVVFEPGWARHGLLVAGARRSDADPQRSARRYADRRMMLPLGDLPPASFAALLTRAATMAAGATDRISDDPGRSGRAACVWVPRL